MRETRPDGDAEWGGLRKVFDIKELLQHGNGDRIPALVGVADGGGAIFVNTADGIYTIDLKSQQTRKVCKSGFYHCVFPYMSFCTPACASGRQPSPVGSRD
uniref:Uncharacterized protein n=1 Tax=Arundo donax TaxID=35708 RepID=A0A0A8XMU2_ARUDO